MGAFRRTSDTSPSGTGDGDSRALEQLVATGAVLGRDRMVQHFLVCETRPSAKTATMQLHDAGFDASAFENPTASGWIVVAERLEALDVESIGLTRSLLELIADRAEGARYDGWRTVLLADEELPVPGVD